MMPTMRALGFLLALVVATPTMAEPGISLFWDSCNGSSVRTFACNTNTGTDYLFGSFVPPAGITAMTANEVVLHVIQPQGSSWPSWWEFKNTGSCRTLALSVSFNGTTDSSGTCTDYWAGRALGGIGAYQTWAANIRRIVLVGAVAIADAGPVDPAREYFSFRLGIDHRATVGSTACSGCAEQVCIALMSIKLTQPVGLGDHLVTRERVSTVASWQQPCFIVPVRNRTWGAVKALYR